jgi:deazaflavin-dependent oxidoreductase (nitroreductase family)
MTRRDDVTSLHDWNRQIIEEFRANEGRVGGQFKGAPMLLLTSSGAKTGKNHTTPAVYYQEGDTLYIFASKGGAPSHPDWYRNLVANPQASIEVGTDKFHVEAEVVTGAERDRIFAANAAIRPAFADYQKRTSRQIPVIALRRKK